MQKALDPGPAQSLLTGWGWSESLVWAAMLYNALAAAALISGLALRPAALSLAAYCGLTSFFHLIPEDPWQMTIFIKNWAITGGCLVLAGQGGGDWVLGSRRQGSGAGN